MFDSLEVDDCCWRCWLSLSCDGAPKEKDDEVGGFAVAIPNENEDMIRLLD